MRCKNMNKKVRLLLFSVSGGLFLLFDQYCKHLAQTFPNFRWYLVPRMLGWEYFENPGVAFGVPLPQFLILLYTPIILVVLFFFYKKKKRPSGLFSFSIILIFFGALSNFIDRILFSLTIDYLRIFTGIFNIADFMILGGAILLLWDQRKK